MNDARDALLPGDVAKLWSAIETHTMATRSVFLVPTDRIPGASALTEACRWTAPAVLVDVGLRPSELSTLNWSDIQGLDTRQAWINILATNSKSHRARQISCTARLTTRLAVHRELQRKARGPHPAAVLHAYPAQAAPISTRTIQRWIEAIGYAALGRGLRPYDLRHTYATILLGVADIETVRVAMGHRHLSTTQQYLHTQPATHRSAAGKFEQTTEGA